MKKRSALIFGLLAALLALSMVVTGCKDPNGGGEDGGATEWPEAWYNRDTGAQIWGTAGNPYPYVQTWNTQSGSFLYYYTAVTTYTTYKLQSFNGDGTSTGSFKVKKLAESEETGSELTVTYTMNTSATPNTLKLVSTDITEFGADPGKTYTRRQ